MEKCSKSAVAIESKVCYDQDFHEIVAVFAPNPVAFADRLTLKIVFILYDIPRSVHFFTYQIVISARIEKKDKQIDENNAKKMEQLSVFCLFVWIAWIEYEILNCTVKQKAIAPTVLECASAGRYIHTRTAAAHGEH